MDALMDTYPIRKKLPVAHSTEIGRIITRFAYTEYLLRALTYNLLRVGPKQGRLAVKDLRPAEQITLIEDLSKLVGLKLNADWKELKRILREYHAVRNKLAHGIWVHHSETNVPVLQDLSGAYVDTGGVHTKPRINPISVPMPIQDLKRLTRNIGITNNYLRGINLTVIRSMRDTSPDKPQQ